MTIETGTHLESNYIHPNNLVHWIFLSLIFLSSLERPMLVHVDAEVRRLGQQEFGRIDDDREMTEGPKTERSMTEK